MKGAGRNGAAVFVESSTAASSKQGVEGDLVETPPKKNIVGTYDLR